MLRRLIAIGVFVLALAPSAYLAWTYRAMPHLGYYHDDSLYFVSGKSLAAGDGYRISSLPGEPFQTKYPPLYSALLAIVWKIDPSFPSNLPIATLLAWLLLPAYLAMVWLFLRQLGFSWRDQCVLVVVAGLSPIAAVFSFSLMPELLFTALLLGSVCLAERALEPNTSAWLPVLAGICGALAYLTGRMPGAPAPHTEIAAKGHAVAEMLFAVEAARALYYRAISEAEVDPPPEVIQRARAAHVTVQRTVVAVTQEAIRVCGGRAFLKRFPLERYARDARAAALMRPWTEELAVQQAWETALGLGARLAT